MCKSFLVETIDDSDSVVPYGTPVVPYGVEAPVVSYGVEAVPGKVEAPAPPYGADAPAADVSTPAPKGKVMFYIFPFFSSNSLLN